MTGWRRVAFVLVAFVVASTQSAPAEQPAKVWRVGFLGVRFRSTPERPDIYYDEWLSAMQDLGYVEGKNLVVEWRFAENRLERLPELAAELAALKPDVIVTHALPPMLALQRATRTIPIVFAALTDPVGNQIVPSLARPGGNTTGLSLMSGDVSAKRVELLKQLIPGLSSVAVLVNPENPADRSMLNSTLQAASVLRIRVLPVEARNRDEIERGLGGSVREHADSLIVLDDGTFNGYMNLISTLAVRRRLPVMCANPEWVDSGGLVGYGTSGRYCYRQAAALVDKILKGASPAEIPVEQPTKLYLVINRKTAMALGLTIPPELLLLADRVIE